MLHQIKTLFVSSLVILSMLVATACDPQITAARLAQYNYVASSIIQSQETFAETLVYGESRLPPADANVLMEFINYAAGVSSGIASAQLKDGGIAQVLSGIDTVVKFKPKFSDDPKNAQKIGLARLSIDSIQTAFRIANVPDKGLFVAAEEDRPKVQLTIKTSDAVIARIVEWRAFYNQK